MNHQSPASQMHPQLAQALRIDQQLRQDLGAPEVGIEGMRKHAELARRWWNEGGPAMANEIEADVPVAGANVRVVVYVPTRSATLRPAYLYLHGGGFRVGGPRSDDRMLRELAAAWGGVVVSVDYVKLPELVFPVAVEQTVQVYQWLRSNGAAWGIDGERLAFGGSSAGASISLGAAVQLGGAGTAFLRAGVLLVGFFDTDADSESMRLFGDDTVPGQKSVRATLTQYLPNPALRADPRVNLVLADPRLLPPLFIAAAELDVLRDSSRRLAAMMQAAGQSHQFVEYQGMTHRFISYSRIVETASRCIGDMAAFLTQHMR